jgi:hypothetical protein
MNSLGCALFMDHVGYLPADDIGYRVFIQFSLGEASDEPDGHSIAREL